MNMRREHSLESPASGTEDIRESQLGTSLRSEKCQASHDMPSAVNLLQISNTDSSSF